MALRLQTKDLYDIIEKRHPDWPEGLDKDTQLWSYNGLDSAVTLMVHHSLLDTINRRNDPFAATSYRFVRAMQGPAMAMMLRGVMIQQRVRQDETARCQEQRARAQALLDRLCDAVWGPEEYTQVIKSKEWVTPIGKRGQLLKPRLVSKKVEIPSTRPRGLNPASPQQVLAFFNGALNFPVEYEIRKTATGNERTPTANDNTLRKWAGRRMKGPGINVRDPSVIPVKLAQPFVSLILTLRDLDKQLMILRTPLEPNGRMTCSYNVAGPETGRWSSSKNAYGRGTNLQNVTNTMRRMFCADDGWYLVSPDLEQAESYITAGCVWMATGDRTYLDAIKSGDLHTRVCMMAWPELGWQGTDPKHPFNRAIADRRYPDLGGLTYRDVAKRIGHGCVTPDHEVLTKNGWVPISDQPDEIMGLDQKCYPVWQNVSAWNVHPFSGDLYHFEGRAVDQLVTPNHRMIFARDPGGSGKLTEERADLWEKSGSIPLGFGYAGGTKSITPEIARFIAAVQADGNLRSNGVRFHFHKERKFDRLLSLCNDAGFPYERKGEYVLVRCNFVWPKSAGAYLLSWPGIALRAYSDEHKHWDGHQAKTAISITSKDRNHLEWLQTINRLIGKGGNIQKPTTSGFGTKMWKLQENNRYWASRDSMTRTTKPYIGTVYCPTVSTGMFYVRRNGKISVTGNSNYGGTPFGIAAAVGIPHWIVEEFQARYFNAFRAIRKWHEWVKGQILAYQSLTTPLLRQRIFFNRPNDPKTVREAIAYVPQSTVAELLNLILYRVWYRSTLPHSHPDRLRLQVLLQNHDAFLAQIPDHPATIAPTINAINVEFQNAVVPFQRGDELLDLVIPGEFTTGWNWSHEDPKHVDFEDGNPDGLRKWDGGERRKRRQTAAVAPNEWLQGPLPNIY